MRSLKRARERAHACRLKIGGTKGDLFERVKKHIEYVHGVELIPVESEFLKGGKAEVSPTEGCLFYDKKYDQNPAERLFVILHELGHLELHPRLKRRCAAPDPVYGSMYLNDGAPAMARYNRRSQDEAEANAFATEFLCPCDEVFDLWRNDATGNSGRIARRLGIPTYIVQAQLAEALYTMSLGDKEGHDERGHRTFKFNESQEEAATFTGAPALVNAGPGELTCPHVQHRCRRRVGRADRDEVR
jgi:Zn-dependent peptidase ImmA (M78 family)